MTSTTLSNGYAPSRSPAAMIGAIGIPGGLGAIIIAGLAVTVIVEPVPEDDFEAIDFPIPEIDPPPDPVTEPAARQDPQNTVVPPIPQPLSPTPPQVDAEPITIGPIVDPIQVGPVAPSGPIGGSTVVPRPLPTFDPIAASPRNDPSRWITDRDYRPSWVRREYAGIARFSLEVSASGRVVDCTITRSTTYSALDSATCALITKRARFEPARDNAGNPTSGIYTSSVRWRLPE